MAESTAKLRQEILALSGVDIMLDDNTFKSTYQIMDELADKWQDLTDIQQASITELIAGKRQGNIVSSLMNNFDIAEQALQTSLNSSGSAMKEHEKWQQSLEAQLNRLKASWQGLSQAFLKTDFLKIVLDAVIALVDGLTKLVDTFGTLGTVALGAGIIALFKNWSVVMLAAKKAVVTLALSLATGGGLATAAGIAKAAISSLWGVIAAHPILAAVAAIGLVVNAYKNAKEEAAAARQEIIESSDAYLDAADSFEQAYIKYSGKTNLTAEEEAELETAIHGAVDALGDKSSALQSAVNSSDDYIASLEAIKNAELKTAEEIAQAKKKAAEETLKESAIGWESFDGSEVNIDLGTGEASKVAKKMDSEFVNAFATTGRFQNIGTKEKVTLRLSGKADTKEIIEYYNFLKDYQEELKTAGLENTSEYKKVEEAIGQMTESIGLYTEGVCDAVKAQYQLANGIPKTAEEYLKMREAILTDSQLSEHSLAQKMEIANTLDAEYGQMFDLTTNKIQSKKLIGVLDEFGDKEALQMEAFLDMRTAVNKEECSVGDYISQFENINKMTEGWSDQAKEELKLSFGLDTDTIKKQYDDLLKELPDKIGDVATKDFLGSLSKSELSAVYSLKGEIDWVNGSPKEILAQIEEQARLNEAMLYTIAIDVETAGIEALNTALNESRSAIGLTSESIAALEDRYSDLDGYNAAALFEETAIGVRLNNEELARLEAQYENFNKLNIDSNLNTLVTKYKEVTEEIKNCTDAQEKEALQAQANTYADKINELSMLASQYDGLTSSFNKWQNALSSANDGDNYVSIYDNLESMKELRDGGLVGTDDFKTAAQLMTNKDLSNASVDEFVSAFDKGYPKMQRYFTEGQKGCQNFLNDLNKINSEWAHMNKDGSWEINFNAEEAAKELDLDVSTILAMADRLKDYGFEINLEDSSLDNLQTKIEEKEAKLKELGQTPYSVDLTIEANVENLGTIESEIDKIKTYISEVNNNSSIDIETKTAQLEDAQAKLEALIDKKIEASQPAFMTLDTSQVNASLVEALEKIQAYQNAINDLNKLLELKEAGIVIDDSQITIAQQKADECVKAIQSLEGEVKVAIGLEEDGSIKSIEEAFENGEVNIDANTDPAVTKIEMLAENVERIEDKNVTINVTVNGLDDVKELNKQIDLVTNIDGDIDKLSKYVESAKTLSELDDNIASFVTAEIKGNVLDKKDKELEKLKIFADGVKELESGNIISNVTANTLGNVFEDEEEKIDNLRVFIDSAKGIKDIEGNIISNITANTLGSVFEEKNGEKYIDNLKTYIESASGIKDVEGNIISNITANTLGSVFEDDEDSIDNLKVFIDSAKGIKDINSKTVNITANTLGSVFEEKNGEKYIDNLKVFAEGAEKLQEVNSKTVNITANTLGDVFENKNGEKYIDNLKVFAEGAEALQNIESKTVNITANTLGDVFEKEDNKINNLKVFAEGAKTLQDIESKTVNITANTLGDVFENKNGEKYIDNLDAFAKGAQALQGVSSKTVNITANTLGSVFEEKNGERYIDNLKVFAEGAKELQGVNSKTVNITANTLGDVFEEGKEELNNLKTFAEGAKELQGAESKTINITANANGNVISGEDASGRLSSLTEFKSLVSGMSSQTVTISVTANVASEKINEAIDILTRAANSGVFKDYNATVQVGAEIATIDDTVVQNYKAPKKEGKVSYSVDDKSPVYTWDAPKKYGVVNYSAEVEALTDAQKHKTGTITYKASVEGVPEANGTANVNGTAFINGTNGKAYRQGNWGTKKTEVALTGELGQELVVYKNRYWTVGDNGAEFATIPKGAIVFNHKQTEELFKNGKVTSDGGRGKALVNGTALAEGNAFVDGGGKFYGSGNTTTTTTKKEETTTTTTTSDGSSTSSKSSSSSSSSTNSLKGSSSGGSSSSSSEFEETFDWIETAIDRIERAIDRLDKKSGNIYASWSDRNKALTDEISTIEKEINLQQSAYSRYMQEANSVGLSESWAKLVRDGAVDITTLSDSIAKGSVSIAGSSADISKSIESIMQSTSGLSKEESVAAFLNMIDGASSADYIPSSSKSYSSSGTSSVGSIKFYSSSNKGSSSGSSSDEKSANEILAEKINEYQEWYFKNAHIFSNKYMNLA